MWDYFYDTIDNSSISTSQVDEVVQTRVEQYLDKVEPVLIGICEAVALITYNQPQGIPDTPSCG